MSTKPQGNRFAEGQQQMPEREESQYVDCYTGAFGVGAPLGFSAYAEVIAPTFDLALGAGVTPETFFARTRVVFLPDVTVSYAAGSSSRFTRSGRTIAAQGTDQILVICYTSGHFELRVAGETRRVEAGDLAFIDLTQEVEIESFGVETLSLAINRSVLTGSLGDVASLHGHIRRADAVTRLFERNLETVISTGPRILRVDGGQVAALMVQLVRGSVGGLSSGGVTLGGVVPVMALRGYIEGHLLEADLGVDRLCRVFGLGRSTLYRVFSGSGGVVAYIQRRRLSYAYGVLRGGERVRVSLLAHALGYGPASFSRRFRAAYGMSPREVMAAGNRGRNLAESSEAPLLVSRAPLGYLQLVSGME